MKTDKLPIGTILIWAGDANEISENWKVCNGKQLMKTEYSDLYQILGTRWDNDHDYHSDFFSIPDLRGVFLRGVNDDRNDGYHDPNVAERIRLKGQSTTSMDDAGSYQKDAFKSHRHQYTRFETTGQDTGAAGPDGDSYKGWNLTVNQTEAEGDGEETRPVNAYVYFIIKIKNHSDFC